MHVTVSLAIGKRRDNNEGSLCTQWHPIMSSAFLGSMFALFGEFLWPGSFIFTSNMSIVFVMYRITHLQRVSLAYTLSMFPIMLSFASSLSFHAHPVSQTKHTLDIACGWIMYVHIFVISLSAALRSARQCIVYVYASLVGIVLVAYDFVYSYQVLFYCVSGGCTYILTYTTRWRATQSGTLWSQKLLEPLLLLVLQVGAALLQGDVWPHYSEKNRHTFIEHGYWHIYMCIIVSVVTMINMQSICNVGESHTACFKERKAIYAVIVFILAQILCFRNITSNSIFLGITCVSHMSVVAVTTPCIFNAIVKCCSWITCRGERKGNILFEIEAGDKRSAT
jgi:hypothetical protein